MTNDSCAYPCSQQSLHVLKKHCSVYRFYDQLEAAVAEEGVGVGVVAGGVMGGVVDEVSPAPFLLGQTEFLFHF
jgi:hypothetical protein